MKYVAAVVSVQKASIWDWIFFKVKSNIFINTLLTPWFIASTNLLDNGLPIPCHYTIITVRIYLVHRYQAWVSPTQNEHHVVAVNLLNGEGYAGGFDYAKKGPNGKRLSARWPKTTWQ